MPIRSRRNFIFPFLAR